MHPNTVVFPVLFSPTKNVNGRIRTSCGPAKHRTSSIRNRSSFIAPSPYSAAGFLCVPHFSNHLRKYSWVRRKFDGLELVPCHSS